MGHSHSKQNKRASFDQVKSSEKPIIGRQKNVPLCLSNETSPTCEKPNVLNEKTRLFVEDIILIWLDGVVSGEMESIKTTLFHISRLTHVVKTYASVEKCLQFIKLVDNHKIFLIASGTFGSQIVPHIENLNQIHSVYIFCKNRQNHVEWTKAYPKIRNIHTSVKDLCSNVRNDIRQYEKSLTPFTILPMSSTIDLNQFTRDFIYLHLMKAIILDINFEQDFRKEFLSFARPFYSKHEQQLGKIDSFNENYNFHSPIWWYTQKSFLYHMMRKAFLDKDAEVIYKLAFFIRDLHRDIKKSHAQAHSHQYHELSFYRAAALEKHEIESIEKNPKCLISFNDFFVATLEPIVARKFANMIINESNSIAVIYQININPLESNIPFIALNNLTYLSTKTDEILFSMNTIFHMNHIEQVHERLYEVSLSPVSSNSDVAKNLVDYMKDITCGLTGWYKLSKVLMDMSKYELVEQIYKFIYEHTNENSHDERAFLQHELGYVKDLQQKFSAAIDHYKTALEIYYAYLPSNHPTILPTYVNLAGSLQKLGDFTNAIEYYTLAMKIDRTDYPNKSIQYNNIGKTLKEQGKYAESQQIYEKSIRILKEEFPTAHPVLADAYHNMADLFYAKKDYTKALSYYKETLSLEEGSLSAKHPSLVTTHYNIATTYEHLKDCPHAIKHIQKAMEVARLIYGDDHDEVKEIMKYLKQLQQNLN